MAHFKKALFLTFSILVICLVGLLTISFNGFCFNERRFLTDEEKIDLVLDEVIKSYPPVLVEHLTLNNGKIVSKWFHPKNAIAYKNKSEFFKINDKCCEIVNFGKGDFGLEGSPIPFFSKLSGGISTFVRVRYLVRFKYSNSNKIFESYYAVSNCGRVWSGI